MFRPRALPLIGALALIAATACDKANPDQSRTPNTEAKGPVEATTSAAEPTRPKVAVIIVVDQMRADYFDRFGGQLEGGLARLAHEGVRFTDARHAHALTMTAPGHASISTGTHPSHHGIISNKWYDDATHTKVMSVDSPEFDVIGKGKGTGLSPKNLMRPAIGDWVHATYPESKVVSVSLKDRAAMMLGGKKPDGAYWFEDSLGVYTTSTYYRDALPPWVDTYNAEDRAATLYGDGWTPLLADDQYSISRAVTERVNEYDDYALTTQFPHTINKEGVLPKNTIRQTPFGDQMTLELARAAIDAEGIGADDVPDVLLISLSGGDYVGHRYGPYSKEMQDYYLRMDRYLGEFLSDLDRKFGQDYVLAFSSDHGVVPSPEFSGIETAGRFDPKKTIAKLLKPASKTAKLSKKEQPQLIWTDGVNTVFPEGVDETKQVAFRAALADEIRNLPVIADAFTIEEIHAGVDREYADAWIRSFYEGRSPDILVQFAPGVVPYESGSTHGTPYDFDNHVPLIFMGHGLEAKAIDTPVQTVDLAPSVATLLGAEVPADVDGRPLQLP